MMRPAFSVTLASTPEARRLVDADDIRGLAGIPSTVLDATLNAMIDAALAQCARSCRLARYRDLPVTLAREELRASWPAEYWPWMMRNGWLIEPTKLILPWRAPIVTIDEVLEGDATLIEDTDFRLLGAGVVERIGGCWGSAVVVDYTAGFVPLESEEDRSGELPADIVALLADQVRMVNDRAGINLNLRSEDIPSVWSGTYNVPGGDAVETGGLLRPLYDALSPYRAPPSVG